MAQELLFTSAPKGLRPGASGYCTVACSQGMSPLLTERLESLSGYRHLYLPGDPQAALNPVNFSHVQFSLGNRSYSLLSRIASFGSDYTHRSNKLAHHLVLEPAERLKPGPAWLLSQPQLMRDRWDGEVAVWPQPPSIPNGAELPALCRRWAETTGDGGWGGVLAEAALADPSRPCYLIFPPGADILPLFRESVALRPPQRRWDVTFSTFYTGLPQDVRCAWRGVVAGSDNAQAAQRHPQALVIDLTQRLPQATGGELVATARTGQAMKLPAAGSGRLPVPGANPPMTFAPAVPPPVLREPPARDASRREARGDWMEEADDSSGTYRLKAAAVSPPPPPLVAVPMGAPPYSAPPPPLPLQAVPIAPPPVRSEPPPVLPPGVAAWKPIAGVAAAVLLLGIGVLLGRSGNGGRVQPESPDQGSSTGQNETTGQTGDRIRQQKADTHAQSHPPDLPQPSDKDDRPQPTKPAVAVIPRESQKEIRPETGGSPPDTLPNVAFHDQKLVILEELKDGIIHTIPDGKGPFLFRLYSPASSRLVPDTSSDEEKWRLSKNKLMVTHAREAGTEPQPLAELTAVPSPVKESPRHEKSIVLSWKEKDVQDRAKLDTSLLMVADYGTGKRWWIQLAPPFHPDYEAIKAFVKSDATSSVYAIEFEIPLSEPSRLGSESVVLGEKVALSIPITKNLQQFTFSADAKQQIGRTQNAEENAASPSTVFRCDKHELEDRINELVMKGRESQTVDARLEIDPPHENMIKVKLSMNFGQKGLNAAKLFRASKLQSELQNALESAQPTENADDRSKEEAQKNQLLLDLLVALKKPETIQIGFEVYEQMQFEVESGKDRNKEVVTKKLLRLKAQIDDKASTKNKIPNKTESSSSGTAAEPSR